METRFMKRVVCGACAVLLAAGAQAALQDRDLDGDTVVDAFYDTDLGITWLRDANVNGAMDWATAVSWADNFSFGGYSDWRLPVSDQCSGPNCTGSEMGHLYYTELGNTAGDMTNTGGFQNLGSAGVYWSGTVDALNPPFVVIFFTASPFGGFQGSSAMWASLPPPNSMPLGAMAVRPGDVAVVPEPETYALMLAGLAGLALARRQRQR